MKRIVLYSALLSCLAFALAPQEDVVPASDEISKTGFLTTEACFKKGEFVDCSLETIQTSPFVLYVHDEDVAYKLDIADIANYPLYEDIGKNGAKVVGKTQSANTIKVRAYAPAPAETKSFFKGCM